MNGSPTNSGCYAANTTGLLIPDATAGTAIIQEDMGKVTVAVAWPPGYTGRRTLFDQVDVLDQTGHVVARTGNRVELLGGYDDGGWLTCDDAVYPPAW